MLKIGTMVALVYYNDYHERPIGIVVKHDKPFNIVKWTNTGHRQNDGGYFDASLLILNEENKDGS